MTRGSRASSVGESLVRRYWESYDPYDARKLARLRHEEWQLEWPQSGERILSTEDDRTVHDSYPGYPRVALQRMEGGRRDEWALSPLALVRVMGTSNLWMSENLLEYPSGQRYHEVSILELRDGLVWRQTDYFAAPFTPPGWRERWVERIEATPVLPRSDIRSATEDERGQRAAVERYVERFGAGDRVGAVEELMRPDAIVEWPQSGERIRGLTNYASIVEHHPTPPNASLQRLVGSGDFFILELLLDYDGTPYYEVACLEFHGKQVGHLTAYFAEPFDAPEWRTRWTKRG